MPEKENQEIRTLLHQVKGNLELIGPVLEDLKQGKIQDPDYINSIKEGILENYQKCQQLMKFGFNELNIQADKEQLEEWLALIEKKINKPE